LYCNLTDFIKKINSHYTILFMTTTLPFFFIKDKRLSFLTDPFSIIFG